VFSDPIIFQVYALATFLPFLAAPRRRVGLTGNVSLVILAGSVVESW
jgi:hypothetical protein